MTRLLLVFWTCFCVTAFAEDIPALPEPGSHLDQLDQTLYRCTADEVETRCARPGEPGDRMAGEQALEVVLFYRSGVLSRAVLVFDEQRYDRIAAGLSDVLGTAEQTREALKAGMGGVFDNRQHIWRHDGRVWMLEQFFERIIHSGLCVTGEAEYEKLMAEREASRVRGARDL